MIGHVNTIDHDTQQGSMFKSLSLNLMHGVYVLSKLIRSSWLKMPVWKADCRKQQNLHITLKSIGLSHLIRVWNSPFRTMLTM